MSLPKEEIHRKVLHVFSGSVIPALILYIPLYATQVAWLPGWFTPRWYAPALALCFSILFIGVDQARFRNPGLQKLFYSLSGSAMRPDEKTKMTGATYMVAAACICSFVFVGSPYISFMVLCSFIWGDAVAALVGQSIGKIKIGKKSLEGSASCFVLCVCLYFFVFPHVPRLLDAWNGTMPIVIGLSASLCITLMELFPIKISGSTVINDNLTAPVITGLLIEALRPFV